MELSTLSIQHESELVHRAPLLVTFGSRSFLVEGSQLDGGLPAVASFLSQKLSCRGTLSFRFTNEHGHILSSGDGLPSGFVRASLCGGLAGGKGGFGANLKATGKGRGGPSAAGFGACRDLYGRRLSTVNAQVRLQLFLSNDEADKKKALEAWQLGTPNWSENRRGLSAGGAKKANFKAMKRKTELCRDWMNSRDSSLPTYRPIPASAPPWWGCPRGVRCSFAHGEDDLVFEVRQELAKQQREEAKVAFHKSREEYTKGIRLYDNGSDARAGIDVARALNGDDEEAAAEVAARSMGERKSMLATVVQGLKAAKQREKGDTDTGAVGSSTANHDGSAAAVGSKRTRQEFEAAKQKTDSDLVVAASLVSSAVGFDPHNWALPVYSPDEEPLPLSPNGSNADAGGLGASIEFVEKRVTCLLPSSSSSSSSSAAAAVSVDEDGSENKCLLAEIEGKSDFSTVVIPGIRCSLNSTAKTASFYWEVELLTAGVMQIGWVNQSYLSMSAMVPLHKVTVAEQKQQEGNAAAALLRSKAVKAVSASSPTVMAAASSSSVREEGVEDLEGDTSGVGDDEYSWAYDGHRGLKFHGNGNNGSRYPSMPSTSSSSSAAAAGAGEGADSADQLPLGLWQEGDVVGCLLTLERYDSSSSSSSTINATFRYTLNGIDLGVAFEERSLASSAASSFSPALSLEGGELCRINIGSPASSFYYARSIVTSSSGEGKLQVAVGDDAFVDALPCADARVEADKELLEFFASSASSSSSATTNESTGDSANDNKRRKLENSEEPATAFSSSSSSSSSAASAPPAPTTGSSGVTTSAREVDLTNVRSEADLALLGYTAEELKTALQARGLKAGGTWTEKAARLLAVKHLPKGALGSGLMTSEALEKQVPAKLRAADFPGEYYR
jgi:Replication stress response SDE2 C-terminal/Silencing defective 2 N-terminal ubiquitin domain/SPRY domain